MIMTFSLRTFFFKHWPVPGQFEDIMQRVFPHKAVEFIGCICNHFVVAIRVFCISVASETFAILVCMTKAVGPLRHNLCVMSILQSDQEPISRSLQLPYKP